MFCCFLLVFHDLLITTLSQQAKPVPLPINDFSTLFTYSGPFAVFQEFLPDSSSLFTAWTNKHDIGNMDGSFSFDNSPPLTLGPTLGMSFYHIQMFNNDASFRGESFENLPTFSFFFARNDFNHITFFDMQLWL
jgi:hypothetical protein